MLVLLTVGFERNSPFRSRAPFVVPLKSWPKWQGCRDDLARRGGVPAQSFYFVGLRFGGLRVQISARFSQLVRRVVAFGLSLELCAASIVTEVLVSLNPAEAADEVGFGAFPQDASKVAVGSFEVEPPGWIVPISDHVRAVREEVAGPRDK